MLNRNHLALFRSVAEAGGFSNAGKVVHVSQPAISMQVAELEEALGTPLFDRLPRGVRLTDAGAVLLGYAQRIGGLEGEAEHAMRELRGLKRGRLAIGASLTIGGYLLPAVLGEFRRRHPGVELQLVIDNTETIKTRLVDGIIDLGLTEGTLPQDKEILSRVFQEDELIVIAPAHHPLAARKAGKARARPITARQLCAQPLILREPGSGTRAVLLRALADAGSAPGEVVLTLANVEAIKRAVSAGLGLAVVSRLCVTLELAGGVLTEIPVRDLKLRRSWYELTRRGRQPSLSVQAFVSLLGESPRL